MSDDCWPCFAVALGAWLLTAAVWLTILGVFTLETYFIVSFIGLLVMIQLVSPSEPRPRWWRTIRRIEVICMLLFISLVAARLVVSI